MRLLRVLIPWLVLPALPLSARIGIDTLGYFPEDFFAPAPNSMPLLSPDESALIYVRLHNNRQQLILHDIGSGAEHAVTSAPHPGAVLTAARWAGNERIVHQYGLGNLISTDRNGLDAKTIFNAGRTIFLPYAVFIGAIALPRIVAVEQADPLWLKVAALGASGRYDVFRVHARSGETQPHISNAAAVGQWFADLQGNICAGMEYAYSGLSIRYRAHEKQRWRKLDKLFPASAPTRFAYSGRSLAGQHTMFLAFAENADHFLYASNLETGRMAIYRMQVSSGTSSLVAADPEYDLFAPLTQGEGPLYSRHRGALVGVHYQAEVPRTIWLDPDFAAIQEAIDANLPGRINRIISIGDGETHCVVYSISSRDKGSYHLHAIASGATRLVGRVDQRIRPEDMAAMRPVEFTARDGKRIHGYLTIPAATSAPPLVVLIHGGPWVRDTYRFDPEVQYLANNGFAVLQVNFRGSAGYGFAHMDALRGVYGLPAVHDIEDGIDWALAEHELDAGNVMLMGASYGGYATVLAMLERPHRYRCGVAMMGVYDLVAHAGYIRDRSGDDSTGLTFWQSMLGISRDKTRLRTLSLLHRAGELQAPLLVIHGDADTQVPISQSEQLVEELQKHAKPHAFIRIEGEGHGFQHTRNIIHAYDNAARFLRQHLP
jgi:dienelactone hydrolase